MRVLICGDRNWDDREHHHLIQSLLCGLYDIDTVGHLTTEISSFTVIEGGAKGADAVASQWAEKSPMHSHNERPDDPTFAHWTYPADWTKHGKAAGPIRNQQMLDENKPDVVLAFHDDLEASKGTKDMVNRAMNAGVPTYLIQRLNVSPDMSDLKKTQEAYEVLRNKMLQTGNLFPEE